MSYGDQSEYGKYQGSSSECSGCDGGCGQATNNCDCCPPGTVMVSTESGKGCLTPQDAAQFLEDTRSCADGYIAVYKTSTGKFYGCVSEANYVAVNAAVNP